MSSTSNNTNTFTIFVKRLTGTVVKLTVTPDTSIAQVKEMFRESQGIPTSQQTLILGGKQLSDGEKMKDLNITDQTIIHAVLRLPGGF